MMTGELSDQGPARPGGGPGGPLLVALALLPFRAHLSPPNEALVLVVAVVAIAASGTRTAAALAALSAATWFGSFSSPGPTSGSPSPTGTRSRRPSCC